MSSGGEAEGTLKRCRASGFGAGVQGPASRCQSCLFGFLTVRWSRGLGGVGLGVVELLG